MSGNRRKGQGRRRGGNKAKPVDLWRPVPPLSDLELIRPVDDPTALVRSLGDPPLAGQDHSALESVAKIASRASKTAIALAYSADLVDMSDRDPDDA